MSQYRAYPAYKDSGVEWIGQVPEEWLNRKVFHAFQTIGSGTTPPSKEHEWYQGGTIPWITTSELRENTVVETKKCVTRDAMQKFSALKIFPASSLAIAMYGATIGRLGFLGIPATTNQACCVLSGERDLNVQFLYYWLMAFRAEIVAIFSEGGGQPNINQEVIASLWVPSPDTDEQATIASTLDRETARIDALIQKKTRFIDLLKEKRQALITHAVTKGLDPNVKMKDSGVEWIGLVPEHWDVKPFFALVTELNRKNVGLVETNILSLSYGNIIQKPETRNMGLTPESYETYQIVESGEIVFRFTDLQNDKRSLRSAQVTQRGIITSAYMAVKPHSIDSTYFAWLMRSYDLCKVFYAMGGGLRQSLKFEDVRRLPVLIPPVDEQSEITNTINAETARIDALVEKTEQSIILLKERRAAFITAAVTGQIDLRGKQ